jgi:putative membrane protein
LSDIAVKSTALKSIVMKKFILALASGCIIAYGCNKGEEEGVVINPQDIGFVHSATLNNSAEIALGQLAADSSQNPAIQAFGQRMVSEHGQVQADLESLATSMNIPTPDTLQVKYVNLMEQLKTLKGDAFDSLYIYTQLADHQNAIVLYSNVHGLGNNSQIKDFARGVLPHLIEHRQEAITLAGAY